MVFRGQVLRGHSDAKDPSFWCLKYRAGEFDKKAVHEKSWTAFGRLLGLACGWLVCRSRKEEHYAVRRLNRNP